MFQLIVAVISIALVAVMIIAAMWFGGDVFAESKQRSMYAEHVNAAAQIDGALQLYYQENGAFPRDASGNALQDGALVQALVSGKYLNSPPNGEWRVSADQLYKPVADVNQCAILNKVAGFDINTPGVTDGCPPCGNDTYKQWPGCMVPTAP